MYCIYNSHESNYKTIVKVLEFNMHVCLTTYSTFTAFPTAGTIRGQEVNEYKNCHKYYYRNKIMMNIILALIGYVKMIIVKYKPSPKTKYYEKQYNNAHCMEN